VVDAGLSRPSQQEHYYGGDGSPRQFLFMGYGIKGYWIKSYVFLLNNWNFLSAFSVLLRKGMMNIKRRKTHETFKDYGKCCSVYAVYFFYFGVICFCEIDI